MPHLVNHVLTKGFLAAESLEPYRLVICNASNPDQVEYPSGQFGAGVIGVTAHAAEAGEPVDVVMIGLAKVQVDGNASNIAIRDALCAHSDTGLAQKVAGGAAGNRQTIGFALETSTADGDIISAWICPGESYFAS